MIHTDVAEDAHREDALRRIGSITNLAPPARSLAAEGATAVMWACTSGSFIFGLEGAQRQSQAISEAAGIPASSTSLAFLEASRSLGLTRVAVAATYPRDVTESFVEFLATDGIETVSLTAAGVLTGAEVGTLRPEEVTTLLDQANSARADALLVPDTALHTISQISALERQQGKPVLTANAVTLWLGAHLAGWRGLAHDLGQLFVPSGGREPPSPQGAGHP